MLGQEPFESRDDSRCDPVGMVVRGRRFHGGDEPARRGVDGDDIGERPADVDPDAEAAGARIQNALRMEEPRSRWRLRIDPSDALIEFISIVLAIVLATAVNSWHEGVQTRTDTHAMLFEIRQEITANRDALQGRYKHHLDVYAAMDALAGRSEPRHYTSYDAMWQTFHRANPEGFMPFYGVQTSWDVAQSTGLLRNVDFDTLKVLVAAYAMQGRANGYLEHLINDLHIVPTVGDNVFYGLVNLGIDLSDGNSNERNLLARYADALAALDRAGIHDQRSARASSS